MGEGERAIYGNRDKVKDLGERGRVHLQALVASFLHQELQVQVVHTTLWKTEADYMCAACFLPKQQLSSISAPQFPVLMDLLKTQKALNDRKE